MPNLNVTMADIKRMYDCSKLSKKECERLLEGIRHSESIGDEWKVEQEIFGNKGEKENAEN